MLFGEWEMLFGEWEMLSGEWETWAFGGPLWGHIGFIRDHSGLTAQGEEKSPGRRGTRLIRLIRQILHHTSD